MSGIIYQVTLLKAEIAILQEANKVLSKYRRAKKNIYVKKDYLVYKDRQDLQDQKDVVQQIKQETQLGSSRKPRTETCIRCCRTCGQIGHNIHTCQEEVDMSGEDDSE
jgi:hypothetical protein